MINFSFSRRVFLLVLIYYFNSSVYVSFFFIIDSKSIILFTDIWYDSLFSKSFTVFCNRSIILYAFCNYKLCDYCFTGCWSRDKFCIFILFYAALYNYSSRRWESYFNFRLSFLFYYCTDVLSCRMEEFMLLWRSRDFTGCRIVD